MVDPTPMRRAKLAPKAVLPSKQMLLGHDDLPPDVRQRAASILARAQRVSRALGAASVPPMTRRAAKDELKAISAEAKSLWEIV